MNPNIKGVIHLVRTHQRREVVVVVGWGVGRGGKLMRTLHLKCATFPTKCLNSCHFLLYKSREGPGNVSFNISSIFLLLAIVFVLFCSIAYYLLSFIIYHRVIIKTKNKTLVQTTTVLITV
jgi:hypothetical protein